MLHSFHVRGTFEVFHWAFGNSLCGVSPKCPEFSRAQQKCQANRTFFHHEQILRRENSDQLPSLFGQQRKETVVSIVGCRLSNQPHTVIDTTRNDHYHASIGKIIRRYACCRIGGATSTLQTKTKQCQQPNKFKEQEQTTQARAPPSFS